MDTGSRGVPKDRKTSKDKSRQARYQDEEEEPEIPIRPKKTSPTKEKRAAEAIQSTRSHAQPKVSGYEMPTIENIDDYDEDDFDREDMVVKKQSSRLAV